jgi:hypothetical protein
MSINVPLFSKTIEAFAVYLRYIHSSGHTTGSQTSCGTAGYARTREKIHAWAEMDFGLNVGDIAGDAKMSKWTWQCVAESSTRHMNARQDNDYLGVQ